MSTSPSLFPKEIEAKDQIIEKQISCDYNPFFNSMLFLYLDNENQEEENNLNNQDTNYNFNELEEVNFLSNELIDELNNCSMFCDEEKENKNEIIINNNIINSLISLAKDGYEFKPKNYKSKNNQNNKKNQNNKIFNYENRNRYNKYKTNKKNSHWGFNYINDKVGVI